jgi:SAM-dependent methyltransferase
VSRTRLGTADLRTAWEQQAAAWIAWARRADDSYSRFHRELFLELVPPPGRRTLDLGCGEGRLSRDLKELGHSVVGVDASAAMLAAAREADAEIETHVADAAGLPFGDGMFDCVVGFMSLQDVDELGQAVQELARVLERGGRACIAIVHPLSSSGTFESDEPDSAFVIGAPYLDDSYYVDEVARNGLEMSFTSAHRPLHAYAEALAEAGLLLERVREVGIPDDAVREPRDRRWQRVPLFLHIRALKP